MIRALIHIALITALAVVLAVMATILIVGLAIACTLWYLRNAGAPGNYAPRSRLKPSINAMPSATSAEPNIYRTETIFSQRNATRR